ncbi:Cytochrome b-c1 complex subunit Rieske, mitochondrial [Operophtera brumata]|uniref:Cytochrome b-c1 complex subunit Rieske, mitochondrial n=1 Tax=Operophtera brumata TaxID=104452 RepID=A0A0L7LQD2_OPEBR|nr:Cytochrome b-c1 complex subunit Rieske, mitochondrial [Operophtera brumata]
MNFLIRGCLAHCGRFPFRTTLCEDLTRKIPNRYAKPDNLLQSQQCLGKLYVLTNLTSWIQVRFNDKCPRLHRDLPMPSFDAYRKEEYRDVRRTDWGSGDGKPGYSYVVSFFGLLCGAYAVKTEATHLILYMATAADVLAMASIEVELDKIAPGACMSYKWRGKPLFIKYRTQVDIDGEASTPLGTLRDPQSPEQRMVNQQWLIVIGICTHLGCVPIANAGDWPGGFYCPCHGSHYDNAGRVRKGPAPTNLEVPPYVFMSDTLVVVG